MTINTYLAAKLTPPATESREQQLVLDRVQAQAEEIGRLRERERRQGRQCY